MLTKLLVVLIMVSCVFVWAHENEIVSEERFWSNQPQNASTKLLTDTNSMIHSSNNARQIITGDEIEAIRKPQIYENLPTGFPQDVIIEDSSSCSSISAFRWYGNIELYCAVMLPPDAGHPYQWIAILKSTNQGASWDWLIGFYSSSTHYKYASIAITQDNVVVAFNRTSNGSIGCFWRRRDGSNYGFSTVDNGPNASRPSLFKWSYYHTTLTIAYKKSGNIMFNASQNQSESWGTPQTVASGNYDIMWDAAITYVCDGSSWINIIAYYDNSALYVARQTGGSWNVDCQINVSASNPTICGAGPNGGMMSLLLYAEMDNGADKECLFAFSNDAGQAGTWSAYYWDDPNYLQFAPIMGYGNDAFTDWFVVSYWDYWPSNNPEVWTIKHYRTDIPNTFEFVRASRDGIQSQLPNQAKTATGYRLSDGLPYVTWTDSRQGYNSVYFNWGDYTGIGESNTLTIPGIISLYQNYPNPIVSKTIIKYSLPKEVTVELKVYDINGNEITRLVNGIQQAGSYYVSWDIHNISKNQFPNGVYFYQLKTEGFTETRKMIVLR